MSRMITRCPSCNSKELNAVKIECSSCQTKFEGNFTIPKLLQLSDEDIVFILDFVKCSGSLKEMSKMHNVSYPTFRNRLNQIIEKIQQLTESQPLNNDKILTMLENREITAVEAALLLKKMYI